MKKLAMLPLVSVLWIVGGCAEDEGYGERVGENIDKATEKTGEAVEETGERLER